MHNSSLSQTPIQTQIIKGSHSQIIIGPEQVCKQYKPTYFFGYNDVALTEQRIWARMDPTNLPFLQLEPVGSKQGTSAMMRNLGTDLWRYTFSHQESVNLMLQIIQQVAKLHSLGYVHGDIKLANILFDLAADPHDDPKVRLIDFGLTMAIGTQTLQLVYAIEYRAPDLCLNTSSTHDRFINAQTIKPEHDLWALGCLWAELLTGSTLFDPDWNIDRHNQILDEWPSNSEKKLGDLGWNLSDPLHNRCLCLMANWLNPNGQIRISCADAYRLLSGDTLAAANSLIQQVGQQKLSKHFEFCLDNQSIRLDRPAKFNRAIRFSHLMTNDFNALISHRVLFWGTIISWFYPDFGTTRCCLFVLKILYPGLFGDTICFQTGLDEYTSSTNQYSVEEVLQPAFMRLDFADQVIQSNLTSQDYQNIMNLPLTIGQLLDNSFEELLSRAREDATARQISSRAESSPE